MICQKGLDTSQKGLDTMVDMEMCCLDLPSKKDLLISFRVCGEEKSSSYQHFICSNY